MLFEAACNAEAAMHTDPRTSCFYARRTLEIAVAWLYRHDASFRTPYQDNLSALIHEPSFRTTAGDAIFTKARLIKDLGNLAVHSTRKMVTSDSLNATRELFHFSFWLARTYGRSSQPAPNLAFDAGAVPKTSPVPAQTVEQLQRLEADLHARDESLSAALADKAALDEELKELREELAAVKKANTAKLDTHDYSEAETRKSYIDVLLKEAGWQLDAEKNFEVEVTGMPNDGGKGYVDYVLWGDDGKPLALIEAKRTTRNPTVGQQQAKLYADCLEAMYGQRPVIFYSNGYDHWIWDDWSYAPRAVHGFYKKAELELINQRRGSRKKLAEAVISDKIVERYYQNRAIRRVAAAFEDDHQRQALLVMATGAGKTRTVIALVDLLMRCNWAKRILFLADRKALVNQALNAFKVHLPNSAPVNLVTDKVTEGRVFLSTYPTMMGLINDAGEGERRFGVGHFDVVIIDEAHRSVYRKYGAIFEYFDSLLVGLTATPKDEIDRNTYTLFNLESGVPTDAYDLEQAVADGHLVPPVAISVPLKFQREGIKYDDLSEDEKEQWDATEWTEDGSTPREVDPGAVNKWLFNTDTVDKALELLMTRGQKVAAGDRLGKTIIFAKNQAHADFISDRFNENYSHYKGQFARVVTYETEYVQSLIDDFSAKEKSPHIAISVDMLDTGIDVPEVVNLVFFKIVRSKTKFWQMVGRGTRLCKDLFGPGQDKENFFIFDFCQNLEFFSQNPDVSDGAGSESLTTRLFKARLEIVLELDKKLAIAGSVSEPTPVYGEALSEKELRTDIAGFLQKTVAAMNLNNFVVRPQRLFVEKYASEDTWHSLGPEDFRELEQHVAALPSELVDEDELAKRFDMMVLRTQLSVLQATADFASLRDKIQAIASSLEEQGAIPAVKSQMELIESVATDEWWQDVTVPMLEIMRRRLRALVKLIPRGEKKIVYTDFEDELGPSAEIDLPQVTAGLNMAKFKDKARQFLREHESHLSLRRLRTNQSLTESDLAELERMLLEAGGSAELIKQAKESNHGLGIFIRSLVGLDREAAAEVFSEFTTGTTMAPNQIEFLDMIIEELTKTGVMEPERLFQSPYTDLNAQGPLGIFPADRVNLLVKLLEQIKDRATA
jgi:type I restriction enzyme R subunit